MSKKENQEPMEILEQKPEEKLEQEVSMEELSLEEIPLEENLQEHKSRLTKKQRKVLLFSGIGVVSFLVILYIGFGIFFQNRFVFGTTINGVACFGKTVKQAEEAIQNQAENFEMRIEGRDGYEEIISGEDIDLMVIFDGEVESIKKEQKPFGWIGALFSKQENVIEKVTHFNEDKLTVIFENLECLHITEIVEPVDATLTYKDGNYEVVKEILGNKIDKEAFQTALWKAISSLEENFSMDEYGCYVNPALVSDSKELLKAKETMEGYLEITITYVFGNAKEVVDESKISQWLYLEEGAKISVDPVKVREYIDELGDKYNTYRKKRTFKTSYDQTVEITQGHYGWRMNRADETTALIEDILAGKSKEKEPLWLQRAQQHGESDIGDTYVEVNLTAQHVFFYKNGSLLIDSGCVTGKVVSGDMTPEGIDGITYKDKDAVLRGTDYATPVTYWMPFNGNIGLHDATWRNKFGGSIYVKSGSHGCVNLPYKTAKTIFENVEAGIPVIVYSLPGTEDGANHQLTQQEQIAAETETNLPEESTQNTEETSQSTTKTTTNSTTKPTTKTTTKTTTTTTTTTTTVPTTTSSEETTTTKPVTGSAITS